MSRSDPGRVRRLLRESVLTGFAIVAPALVTLYVLYLAVGFFFDLVTPLASAVATVAPGLAASSLLVDLGILVTLLVVVVVVGLVAHLSSGERLIGYVDGTMMRIPGVGTVYESFRRIGDAVVASDRRSFEQVQLVELPDSDLHMLGFRIADAPESLTTATGQDLRTLFVPLAPNPVMAGFLVHVPDDRITDVDVSVEEGLSAIVSLGATEADDAEGQVGQFVRSDAD